MSIGKVIEVSATSRRGFEDAIQQGLGRAAQTLEDVHGAWIKEFEVRMEDGKISEYRVDMKVTFLLHGMRSGLRASEEGGRSDSQRLGLSF